MNEFSYLFNVTCILVSILLVFIIYLLMFACGKCKRPMRSIDRMPNGRYRFRLKNTNTAVCRRCAFNNYDEVE